MKGAGSGLFHSNYHEMWNLCNMVYSDYPYLFTAAGKEYEYKYYLSSFEQSPDSTVIAVQDNATAMLVGFATGISMSDYVAEHYKKPFIDKGYDLQSIFYIADVVLLPAYRGKGYEQKMCEALIQKAKQDPRYKKICYLLINEAERTKHLKPQDSSYEPYWQPFWENQGFRRSDIGFVTQFEIIGETDDTPHEMSYMILDLE